MASLGQIARGTRSVGWSVAGQFVGGRYRARYFWLLTSGAVVLALPFLLTGAGEVSTLLVAVSLVLWFDWRHPWIFDELDAVVRFAAVERAGDEIRIWTRTDTYSVRFWPLALGRGYVADEWFAYLQEACPEAEFEIREPEVIRNSRLLKPTIAVAIALMAGVPYLVFAWLAFKDAGWV